MLSDKEDIKYKLKIVSRKIMQYEIAIENGSITDSEREYFVDLVRQEDNLLMSLHEFFKKEIEDVGGR